MPPVRERPDKVPLSVQLVGKVVEAWKIGKAALALLVVGVLSMLASVAVALRDPQVAALSWALLALAIALIGLVAYQFYFEVVTPARKARVNLLANAALVDAVQDAALALTEIITEMNDFALMNADEIVEGLDSAKRFLSLIPGANRVLTSDYLTRSDAFARKIRTVAQESRGLVVDVRDSLCRADAERLSALLKKLKILSAQVKLDFFSDDAPAEAG